MNKTDGPRCSKRVPSGGYHYRKCSRNGVVIRAGEWFCKQHDPVAIIAKEQERYNKAAARNSAAAAQRAKEEATRIATAELVKAALEHWNHPAVDLYRQVVFDK